MNVLVTGGSGFIGSHVVDKLAEAGHDVRVLDIKAPQRDDVEFVQGDILSRAVLAEAVDGMEVVYHLAGFSNINLVKGDPVRTIESNILGTAYLLEECRKAGVKRFLFASSVYAHGQKGHLYTTSKLSSEMLCRDYNTLYSLPYTVLRYGTAYGPRSREADVISIFVERALKDQDLVIHGSGDQKRNFIYVEDMAAGSVAALKGTGENKTYVFAGTETVSIRDLAEIVKNNVNDRVKIRVDASGGREDDYQGELGDLERTMAELGWKPATSLSEGIRKYGEWYGRKYSLK
jgi:UDP-glucose 4-epimerase